MAELSKSELRDLYKKADAKLKGVKDTLFNKKLQLGEILELKTDPVPQDIIDTMREKVAILMTAEQLGTIQRFGRSGPAIGKDLARTLDMLKKARLINARLAMENSIEVGDPLYEPVMDGLDMVKRKLNDEKVDDNDDIMSVFSDMSGTNPVVKEFVEAANDLFGPASKGMSSTASSFMVDEVVSADEEPDDEPGDEPVGEEIAPGLYAVPIETMSKELKATLVKDPREPIGNFSLANLTVNQIEKYVSTLNSVTKEEQVAYTQYDPQLIGNTDELALGELQKDYAMDGSQYAILEGGFTRKEPSTNDERMEDWGGLKADIWRERYQSHAKMVDMTFTVPSGAPLQVSQMQEWFSWAQPVEGIFREKENSTWDADYEKFLEKYQS